MLDPQIKQEIKNAVKETVNGNIDELRDEVRGYRKEHKEHMDEISPMIEAIKAITVGRKAIFWVTSLIVAIGGAFLMVRKLWP